MLLARSVRWVCVGILTLCAGIIAAPARAVNKPDAAVNQASQLVQKALQAEAVGQPDERAANLQAALKAAPDFAPAHWLNGEVQRGDRWMSAEDAAKDAAASGKIAQYRAMRDQAQATYNDQMALADWCKKNTLKDQERAHLVLALIQQPNSKDAMSRLGLVRYRGQLVPREEVVALDADAKKWDASVAQWKGRLQRLRDKAQGDQAKDALAEIRAIRDPAAVPGMESVFGNCEAPAALAVIDALAQMPQQAATNSLVRHAVYSQNGAVRNAAATALGARDIYSYVPLLLANMNSPIETGLETFTDGRGTVAYRLNLFREGTFENVAYSQTAVSVPVPYAFKRGNTTFTPVRTDHPTAMPAPNKLLQQAAQENARAQTLNERVASALSKATYEERSADTADALRLWDWWYDYNEYYTPDYPPTYTYARGYYPTYSFSQYTPPPPPPPGRHSCFPAGTLVWTATGTMQIEKVKVGECVLSQDPETGELAYKTVLNTTIRPASPLVEVRAGNSMIRSTLGHPFWVCGIGWQMAKELKAGQYLHTARGQVLIDSAEPSYDDVCYNLVVAEFNTFFVGDAQVLVHDNNLRGPNLFTVPGLPKE